MMTLTAIVRGSASANGLKYGLSRMNSPVPITNGDAASVRKPTDSTAVAVCFESEAISAASAVADVVVIKAAGIAIDTDFQRAGQTCVGKDRSGCRPLRRIEISGANRKNATNSRSTLSKVRV